MSAQNLKAVLKIRAESLKAARQFLNQKGFVEIQGPVLFPALENGHLGFQVDYFEKKACLSGGLQPYADTFVEELEKIYTIAPTFRAERAKSYRHLTEFWRIEVAAQGYSLKHMLGTEEEMITQICASLLRNAAKELSQLSRSIDLLTNVKIPFPKLTYEEAIEKLQTVGCSVNWGEPITWELEHNLSKMYDQPFFVTEFPMSGNTFFHKSHPEKPELTLSADLYAPEGYGEISTCGEAITEKALLSRKLREMKIQDSDRRWYLSLRSFNIRSQSGFAMGVERLLQWICKLDDIRETTAFPRTYGRVYP